MSNISEKNGALLLNTEHSSLLMLINSFGHLELLHYGAPVSIDDAQALGYRRTIQYGAQVLYEPGDDTYCLDNVPLCWSGIGKGDFRASPAEIVMPDGSYTCDFVYDSHRIFSGAQPPESLPGACCREQDEAQTLVVTMTERSFDVSLKLFFTVFPHGDVITRRAVLINAESRPIQIRRLMSMLIDLPNRGYKLTTFDGDWINEACRHDRKLIPGSFVNSSTTGSSSNRHNPGVLLSQESTGEDFGQAWAFNLVYSGNHYTQVELSPRDMVRVITGINPLCFNWPLDSGESFETPEAVMSYSGEGFNGLSRGLHHFVHNNIVRGPWRDKERPVLLNDWEACFFKFTRRKLLRLARRAKKLGVELFVLDDGWFGARNDDKAGLGDYGVNLKKLPGGLERLAKSINKMGMDFGLWFEPESVNPDSDLYRAHPEWAVALPGREPSLGRNQLLLDLANPDVRDYIVENVSRVLDSCPISYVKWDMNRHMSDMFSSCCPGGEFYHRYIMGLYEVLERIFGPRPQVLLESCSSGGNRFDLGMLCYSPQIWASDDTDPIERIRIQKGLSYLYPQSTMGAHVSQSPHQQTLRASSLATRFNVAAFGALGYELDPGELSPVERRQVRAQIEFYKQHRRTLQFGRLYRYDLPRDNQEALLAVSQTRAVLSLVQGQARAGQPGDVLTVKGLDAGKRYQVRSRKQKVAVSRFGGLLKHILPVSLPADGVILRAANRHYALSDGDFQARASGGALFAGAPLNSQYIGTGYDPKLRLWGDFGSQMYVISACDDAG